MDEGLLASLRAGLAFTSGIGVQDVSLVSARQRACIANPIGSKRNILIKKVIVETNAPAMSFANMVINPNEALSGAATSPMNLNLDPAIAQSSAAVVKADSVNTPLTSATSQQGSFGVPPNTRTVYDDVPFLIPPGYSLGIDVKYLNLLGAIKSELIAVWSEEKLA